MTPEEGSAIAGLRADARGIFDAALRAAHPAEAVRRAIRLAGEAPVIAGEPVTAPGSLRVVALGKAACSMGRAAMEVLPRAALLLPGLAVVHDEGFEAIPDFRVLATGHPLPDARGVEAALEVERYVSDPGPGAGLLLLLSGGGSALLPAPAAGISLEDKVATTRALLRSGAAIAEINAVRKHLSRLKGGGLALRARPALVETIIVSDVVGDDLATIASGPTAPDPTTYRDALEVLERRLIAGDVPAAVRHHLEEGARGVTPETPKPGDPIFQRVRNRVVAGSAHSLEAAAAEAYRRGYEARVLSRTLSGEARDAAARILEAAVTASRDRPGRPLALLAAGETTVTVRGPGRGGRNQELALALALEAERRRIRGDWALLSSGTDGRDGPTDAAGAMVDPTTLERARSAGADPERALETNDSYHLLAASRDHVRTGPTGTNVADLQVLLIGEGGIGSDGSQPRRSGKGTS